MTTPTAQPDVERPRAAARSAARSAQATLAHTAAAIVTVTIVVYHGWLIPYFQPFFTGRVGFARLVFYALYGALALGATIVVVGRRARVRRSLTPFVLVGVLAIAVTALHPIGLVTRAYVISLAAGAAAAVLMLAAPVIPILRLLAAVTALNAAMCFVDLLFPLGFTNTIGRAAGLAQNPNVAAASILLGAAASYRAVPRRFQFAFAVLIFGSLAATLSRSNLLIAVAAAAAPATVEFFTRRGEQRTRVSDGAALSAAVIAPEAVRPAARVAAIVALALGIAAVTNPYFRNAVQTTTADSLSFVRALDDARESVEAAARGRSSPPAGTPAGTAAAQDVAGARPPSNTEQIAAIDTRLRDEGHRNSMSARALFMDRALLVYRSNGARGMGLEDAHPLAPHNTFLLFALAFGSVGWLIPLALIALTLYAARDARDLPLAVAVVGTMATSHDILVMPSLFLPIAIGVGGMLAADLLPGAAASEPQRRTRMVSASVADRASIRSITYASTSAVALFVAGCVAIVCLVPAMTVSKLSPAGLTARDGAYLAYFPPEIFPGLFVPVAWAGSMEPATSLTQESRPLTRVAWPSASVPRVAPGEYAVGAYLVVFATLDGSDPRTSGDAIEFGLPHRVAWLSFCALVLTLAAWCWALPRLLDR